MLTRINGKQVTCSLCNRTFSRTKENFEKYKTCPYCEGNKIFDLNHFKDKIKTIYNDQYDVSSLTDYPGYYGKVSIKCNQCGEFEEKSVSALLNNRARCNTLHSKKVWDTRNVDFIADFKKTIKLENFNIIEFQDTEKKVLVECKQCKKTYTRPMKSDKIDRVCKFCYTQMKSTEQFIKEASELFGDFYTYEKTIYRGAKKKISVYCKYCAEYFETVPNNHLMGCGGCPICSGNTWSKKSIRFLDRIIKSSNTHFQHALNAGEKKIIFENKKYLVDGYNESYKIVIEFHGDVFHGNPKLFDKSYKCHPYSKKVTAGDLYEKTIYRENQIQKAGYNVITIWENDYDNDPEKVLNECINKINTIKNKETR